MPSLVLAGIVVDFLAMSQSIVDIRYATVSIKQVIEKERNRGSNYQ